MPLLKLPKFAEDEFGFALPWERVIALLLTIGLTVFNLQFETKKDDSAAQALKWVLAGFQFVLIGLLLFKDNLKLLGGTFFVSLVSIIPAYFRFKDHENVRLTYLIAQGLTSLGLLGMTLLHITKNRKRQKLKDAAEQYDRFQKDEQHYRTIQANTSLAIEKARREGNQGELKGLEEIRTDTDNKLHLLQEEIKKFDEKHSNKAEIVSLIAEFSEGDDMNSSDETHFSVLQGTKYKNLAAEVGEAKPADTPPVVGGKADKKKKKGR
jgi:hypothetical protein